MRESRTRTSTGIEPSARSNREPYPSASAREKSSAPAYHGRVSLQRAVLAASLLGAAAVGVGYALLFAAPELRSALADGGPWPVAAAHLAAALFFAALQLVAGARVLRGHPAFFAWLAPAGLYLVAIGLAAWLQRGETAALWLDSVRG